MCWIYTHLSPISFPISGCIHCACISLLSFSYFLQVPPPPSTCLCNIVYSLKFSVLLPLTCSSFTLNSWVYPPCSDECECVCFFCFKSSLYSLALVHLQACHGRCWCRNSSLIFHWALFPRCFVALYGSTIDSQFLLWVSDSAINFIVRVDSQ